MVGLIGSAAVVIMLGWLGVIDWMDDQVDLPALPVPDCVQRLLDEEDDRPATTATRTTAREPGTETAARPIVTPFAREPEVVSSGAQACTSSAECLAYLAVVESNLSVVDLRRIRTDNR